jgi:hypothetical protein
MGAGSYERKEFVGGAPATTVVGSTTDVATSLALASATGWPTATTNPFVAVIDRGLATEEKILVGARTGTACSSITRGYDDTLAQAHSSSAPIEHVIDASTIDQANRLANEASNKGEILASNGTNVVAVTAAAMGGTEDDYALIVDSSVGSGLKFGRPLHVTDSASTPTVTGVPRVWYDQNQNTIRTSDGTDWKIPASVYVFANDGARDTYLGGTPTTGATCIVGTGSSLELQVYDGSAWINFPRVDEGIPKFANTAARDAFYTSPATGDHAYITGTHQLTEYREDAWILINFLVTVSASQPASPHAGDIWLQPV